MTIQQTIVKPIEMDSGDINAVDLTNTSPHASLSDEAYLNRMANAFFTALSASPDAAQAIDPTSVMEQQETSNQRQQYSANQAAHDFTPRVESIHSPFYQRLVNVTAQNNPQENLPIYALEANDSPQRQAHHFAPDLAEYFPVLDDTQHDYDLLATASKNCGAYYFISEVTPAWVDSISQPTEALIKPPSQQLAPQSNIMQHGQILPNQQADYYFLFDQDYLKQTAPSGAKSSVNNTEKSQIASKDQFEYSTSSSLIFEQIRRDFPILQQSIHGHPLIWLDSAATTQKPQAVIDRLVYFYQNENSNIHRAAHHLAARATDAYEHARQVVADFIQAESSHNIVFVRGTTEAINLVAKSWGVHHIGSGDEIIISYLEHHANIVPWYQLCQQQGAILRVIPVDDTGQIDLIALSKLINSRTKLLAITHVSNALGTITPIQQVIEMAHQQHVPVLVDAAQSIAHMPTDVQTLDADFLVFSGHKVFGPTGIGVLYAKTAILDNMPVWEGGGNMITDVRFEHVIYQDPPNKFEAGTGNIADAVGLAAALNYIQQIGLQHIAQYEHELLQYSLQRLQAVPSLRLIGNPQQRACVMSFVMTDYSPEHVGRCLNEQGIAVRAGHHCAQPILRRFGVEKTVRPSIAFYNHHDEINQMVDVLQHLHRQRH